MYSDFNEHTQLDIKNDTKTKRIRFIDYYFGNSISMNSFLNNVQLCFIFFLTQIIHDM